MRIIVGDETIAQVLKNLAANENLEIMEVDSACANLLCECDIDASLWSLMASAEEFMDIDRGIDGTVFDEKYIHYMSMPIKGRRNLLVAMAMIGRFSYQLAFSCFDDMNKAIAELGADYGSSNGGSQSETSGDGGSSAGTGGSPDAGKCTSEGRSEGDDSDGAGEDGSDPESD